MIGKAPQRYVSDFPLTDYRFVLLGWTWLPVAGWLGLALLGVVLNKQGKEG